MKYYAALEKARGTADAPWTTVVREDFHVVVFEDKYPVTDGHLLFVPQFNTVDVIGDCFTDALEYANAKVADGTWDGYNIGMNMGEAAGQTVAYPHIHVIPRRKGDMEDPRGGVRHVIPEKAKY
jgi:diadenosine tetraphosphate (Ap4A) HIT family hydrolase